MVQLTDNDKSWLGDNYPELTFDETTNIIKGSLAFSLQYCEGKTISDKYDIEILLNEQDYSLLPVVKEVGGKIQRYATIAHIRQDQLHQYEDGRMCMVRPDKVEQWYVDGFDFKTLMHHIETHLYWVTHTALYGKEPWPGEPHGGEYINNNEKWKKQ